jgi:hypothetical protein
MAVKAIKCYLFFKSLHLFIFFFPLTTFENKRSAVDFSMCYDKLNYYYVTPFHNVSLPF